MCGFVCTSDLPLFLGRIPKVYTKRKNVMPVVSKENEAGTYGLCAIVNTYHWKELFF